MIKERGDSKRSHQQNLAVHQAFAHALVASTALSVLRVHTPTTLHQRHFPTMQEEH